MPTTSFEFDANTLSALNSAPAPAPAPTPTPTPAPPVGTLAPATTFNPNAPGYVNFARPDVPQYFYDSINALTPAIARDDNKAKLALLSQYEQAGATDDQILAFANFVSGSLGTPKTDAAGLAALRALRIPPPPPPPPGGGGGGGVPAPVGVATTERIAAPTVQAAFTTIDPRETTQGVLNQLLDENSPYLQRAKALALQQANERGLINSSIAAGAGAAAAIDAALGIAAPDAQIFNQTRLSNTASENNFRQFNAGNLFEASQFNASAANRASEFNAAAANELQRLVVANGLDIERMGVQQRNQLEQLAVQNVYNQENQRLGATLDLERLAAANGFDLNRLSVVQKQQLEQLAIQQGYSLEQIRAQFANQTALNTQQLGNQLTLNDQQFRQQVQLAATQFGYQTELAKLQQNFGNQSGTFNLASNILVQGSQTINNILLDPNISNEGNPSPKQQLIDKIKENTRNQIAALAATGGVDLSKIFT